MPAFQGLTVPITPATTLIPIGITALMFYKFYYPLVLEERSLLKETDHMMEEIERKKDDLYYPLDFFQRYHRWRAARSSSNNWNVFKKP